jgi:hypothetical protein
MFLRRSLETVLSLAAAGGIERFLQVEARSHNRAADRNAVQQVSKNGKRERAGQQAYERHLTYVSRNGTQKGWSG